MLQTFVRDGAPAIEVVWTDAGLHDIALAAFLASGRRGPSLVDCASFETMRRRAIDVAFAFGPHFKQQGFSVIP